jgi:hypothetical protein
MTPNPNDAACIFFKGALILDKPEAGARSTMQLLLTKGYERGLV